MRVEELRSGNWVEIKSGGKWVATQITVDLLTTMDNLKVRPILSSEDVLDHIEGIRFEQEPYRVYHPRGAWGISYRNNILRLIFKNSSFVADNVHKLQNMVESITGEELSISYGKEDN